ncbi:MAG: alanine/glycine:cation symporter family protein [Candidatus Babeliales bacterium]
MNVEILIQILHSWISGWPLIIFAVGAGIVCTVALSFIQIRYFMQAWKYMLFPATRTTQGTMSPIQAFINTLSANLGNGSVAGMAAAVYSGGPGAAFWVVAMGLIMMSVRFAEVYLSTYFSAFAKNPADKGQGGLGGPMLYLRSVVGGRVLAFLYAIFCFLLSIITGNAMQTNSIGLSVATTWGVPYVVTAVIATLFILFVVSGGSARIVKASEAIVPLKVGIFFGSSIIVLAYHYQSIGSALSLIIKSAFSPVALAGGALGFGIQQAMRYGILRTVLATESGLGTAAILFGATGSKEPVKDGILSMLSTFISTLVCFMIALCIVASGVWDSGLTSTALTIASFNTVFGWLGGWVVSFLSITFGMGVLVAFAYITEEAWLYLVGDTKLMRLVFKVMYCLTAFIGVFFNVCSMWLLIDIMTAGMLAINLFGVLYLLPIIIKGVQDFKASNQT